MKLLLCMLMVLLLLAGNALGETPETVRQTMQELICGIAGAESWYLLDTSVEDAELLKWMKHWFITITDDYVLLETAEDSCLAMIQREDPVEVLALTLVCKAAIHDCVEEDIVVFVEWSDMDSITVDDDAFGLQVKTLEGLGYTQLDKENVLALRREIASALGIYVTDSSFTYYDLYVEDEDDPYVPGKQVCFYCHGVGKCKNCGGDGLYNNPYTGDLMECTCNYGLCPTCDGTGWW